MVVFFFFQCYRDHRVIHSFPTRRSSDLTLENAVPWVIRIRLRPVSRMTMGTMAKGNTFKFWSQASFRKQLCHSIDRKSTRLNSSHVRTSYAVFCLKKKNQYIDPTHSTQS